MSISPATKTSRRPRFKRGPKPLPLRITPRHEEALKLVGKYTYLDGYQLIRLMGLSRARTLALLSDLKHGGVGRHFYLRPVYQPFILGTGSARTIYILDYAGYDHLTQLGCAPAGRFRPDELATKQLPFLSHILETNNVLVLAELLTREQPVTIARMMSDQELHRDPIKVTVKRKTVTCIPDCWIDLALPGDDLEHPVAFEIDRGTMEVKPMKEKIAAYLEAIKGAYQEKTGAQSITIAFIVTSGGETSAEKRRLKLVSWTESVLKEAKQERLAELFRFSAFNPATISPSEAFMSPIWSQPFNPDPMSLLEG